MQNKDNKGFSQKSKSIRTIKNDMIAKGSSKARLKLLVQD